jgi:hypothetical protein
MRKNLVYTVALDRPGETGHRNMAKLLVSSLLRTRFSGDIVVFHTTPYPLFMVAREGVREVQVQLPRKVPKDGAFVGFAQSFKHEIADQIDTAEYHKVMFIDCDSVVLRNIDHLLDGDWDLAVFAEQGSKIQEFCWGAYLNNEEVRSIDREGYNSGTVAVRASLFRDFLQRWRAVEEQPMLQKNFLREQGAFNRVVLDWPFRTIEWPQKEIAMPLVRENRVCYLDYHDAALVHAASGAPIDFKTRFLFGVYASVFLHDTQLTLFNTLEM